MRPARLLPLLLIASPAIAAKASSHYPAVRVYHVNTQKELRFQLYDEAGHPQRAQMKRMEQLLRCHHTDKKHSIHWRLMQLLYRVARHFPAQRVEIVAGYRDPLIARQKGVAHSYHTRGRAVDLRVPGVSNERLRDYLKTFSKVGVGYYPNSHHVHLDVRDDQSAYWVDYAGPGERAAYHPTQAAPGAEAGIAADSHDDEHAPEPAETPTTEAAPVAEGAPTVSAPGPATAATPPAVSAPPGPAQGAAPAGSAAAAASEAEEQAPQPQAHEDAAPAAKARRAPAARSQARRAAR